MSIDELNQLSEADFVHTLKGIYESSPWVPSAAAAYRPFPSRSALQSTLQSRVDAASNTAKLALIRAHPDLGGKLARSGALTPDSTREQSRLGLDQLDNDEFNAFSILNRSYRERFDFPFIICVGLHDKSAILDAFQTRLNNSHTQELSEAIRQIHLIAALRLEHLFPA